MPLRKAARVFAGWRSSSPLRWSGSFRCCAGSWKARRPCMIWAAGGLATFAAIYLLSLLLFRSFRWSWPAAGFTAPGDSHLAGAAVASAATAFSVARVVGRGPRAGAARASEGARARRSRAEAACSRSPWCGSRAAPYTRATRDGLTPMRLRHVVLALRLDGAGSHLYSWPARCSQRRSHRAWETIHGKVVWILLAVALLAGIVLGIAATHRLRRSSQSG